MSEIEKLRKWSAKELMGWEYRSLSHGWYDKNNRTFIPEENWLPDDQYTGQIWLVINIMYKVHHQSLRLIYPAIGDGEIGARVYFYSGQTYCSYQEKPDEFGGPHPNPYVSIKHPKSTPFITDPNPCVAILKAAKAAWNGNGGKHKYLKIWTACIMIGFPTLIALIDNGSGTMNFIGATACFVWMIPFSIIFTV